MAKKSGKKNTAKTGELASGPTGMDAVRLAAGLFFGVVAIYTFISLLFYVFTWSSDQSITDSPDLFSESAEVDNGGGVIGYVWANFLISKLFGLGAFVIPFFFGILSLYALKLRNVNLPRLFFLSLFGCIVFSLLFSYIFSLFGSDTWFGSGAGGSYGYYVNEWLCKALGVFGAGLSILFVVAIWLIVFDRRFVAKFNCMIERFVSFAENAVSSIGRKRKSHSKDIQGSEESVQDSACESQSDDIGLASDRADNQAIHADENPEAAGQNAVALRNAPEFVIVDSREEENDTPASRDDVVEFDRKEEKSGSALSEKDPEREDEGIPSDEYGEAGGDAISGNEGMRNDVPPLEVIGNDDEDFLKTLSDDTLATLFDPRLDLSSYKSPSVDLLEDYSNMIYTVPQAELEKNNRKIVKTLANYGISVDKVTARIGPTVTLYEIVPSAGVRVSQIKRLEDDIALWLAAKGVRIVTLTNAVGIEVANEKPSIVPIKSVLSDPKFLNAKTKYDLPVVMGRTISNEPMMFDLAKMPHLLVAGATGQGKSVGLNAIIASLLYTKHPSELKFVLVDPKKVELSLYSKLEKHFLAKLPDADEAIITDTQKVIYTLKSLCIEMDSRYDLLKLAHVRNIKEYNEKFLSRRLNPNKGHRFMPFIVVIIDEFADLLITAGREIEEPIARLAQLARAIGIHLVIATQRPTTNIITGSIKANFPARIAFKVLSSVDSKTILDQPGANQLIGKGDMLILSGVELVRVQCAFIDTKEVERVADFIGSQRGYSTAYYLPEYVDENQDSSGIGDVDLKKRDKLFEEAAKIVVSTQVGSTSMIQRKMNIGYPRAAKIMDQLEAAGIVGPYEGSKSREVLVTDFNSLDRILESL